MNLLMKLPKSEQYFGYSDDNGVIYFIHSETAKSITKFHKSFNNKGHITVSKSKRPKALLMGKEKQGFQFQYSHGVLLGNIFWTFGGSMIHLFGGYGRIENERSNQTTIWSTKKNVWTKGPEVKTSGSTHIYYNTMDYRESFASVINSTAILLIGGDTVVCFNIVENRWTNYPDFPLYIKFSDMVATTVTIDKSGKRYVFPERIPSFHS